MLHELSLRKFLIGAEVLGGLGNFFVKAAVMVVPFCVLFWFHRKDENIYNRLFILEDLTMYTLFYSFITLTQVKMVLWCCVT